VGGPRTCATAAAIASPLGSGTQVKKTFSTVADKDLPEPLPVYSRSASRRTTLSDDGISFDRQDGCPGEAETEREHLSLFGRQPGRP